jgi:hypothetical protein
MTDTLREIEKGHEAKFKLDQEMQFKIDSRRNKLLSAWASEKMNLSESETSEYAREITRVSLRAAGTKAVIETILDDLRSRDVAIAETEIEAAQEKCQQQAEQFFRNRYPDALDSDHSPVGG